MTRRIWTAAAATIAAKRTAAGAAVSGRVTQAGKARGNATVTIRNGARASALKRLGSVKVRANGTYSFRAKSGTFFRASAVAAAGCCGNALRDANAAARADPVRQPDDARLHGSEQDGEEEVATTVGVFFVP